MTIKRIGGMAVIAGALAVMAGCAQQGPRFGQGSAVPAYPGYPTQQGPGYGQAPSGYSNYPGNPGQVLYGTVQSVDLVQAENQTSGAGAVLGGVIGGVIGRQIGGGSGRHVGTAVGVVGGAVAGNQIEKNQRGARDFYRVNVRFQDGSQRSFDYDQPVDLRPGDRVTLQNNQLVR
jgi:outer membrane lipoprotein SlyB